jgi:hypothetical protein
MERWAEDGKRLMTDGQKLMSQAALLILNDRTANDRTQCNT